MHRCGIRRLALACALSCALPALAQTLAVQLVDPAGSARHANERGDIVGSRFSYPCTVPASCAPVTTATVWSAAGPRYALPGATGTVPVVTNAVGADGTVVGTLTDGATTATAMVWRLSGGAYTGTALGNLGLQQSYASGVDDAGRVVGYAITPFVSIRAFSWTAGGGLVDLTAGGAPADRIAGISPGGRVLGERFIWPIDQPAAAVPLPAATSGWLFSNGFNFEINDGGDLAGFLLTASGQNRYHLHRWQAASNTWQLLDPTGIAPQSGIPLGIGRIDAQSTITATIGQGVIAQGPGGLPQSVSARVSPAYPPNAVQSLAWRTDGGVFVGNFALGTATRLVKLVPIAPCVGACLRVPTITMTGTVQRRSRSVNCGQPQCTVNTATVTVTDAAGNPQANVRVNARFMNSYTLDSALAATTNAAGVATLRKVDYVGMGTVSVFVESASKTGWSLDRGVGKLWAEVIPR